MDRKKYLVVMAGGSGTRMGAQIPKQFIEIEGKAILRRTMEAFVEACPEIMVVTVLPEAHMEYWKSYCLSSGFTCPQVLVKGGITRFHSVRNALEKIPQGALVAVHDGVRPLVSKPFIRQMFTRAAEVPALIPVLPCVDTMTVLENKDGVLARISGTDADRSILYAVQTPQIFHSEVLKSAYEQPYDTTFTDDGSVVERYGEKLSYIIGERLNIKITTQDDLKLAEAIISHPSFSS